MEPTFITSIPLWAINLCLAGLVCLQNPRNLANQAFATFVLTAVGWSFCVQMFYINAAQLSGILWGRLAFAAASLIGSSFVVFCHVFPYRQGLSLDKGLLSFTLMGGLLAGLSLTSMVLRDLDITSTGHIQRHYGLLYPVFGMFLLATFGHGLWTLARKWRTARGRSRLQIQYLWLGVGLTICGGTTTNLIIPTVVGSSSLSAYGPYFSVFFVGFAAHAIIRHRLMDIRVVVRQSVTYGLSVIAAAAILWSVVTLAPQEGWLDLPLSAVVLLMGVMGIVVFYPVRAAIQRVLDKYCYREVYDYRQAIKTLSQMLAGLLLINDLCEQLSAFILTTLKVEDVGVYLCREPSVLERRSYQSVGEDRSARGKSVTVAAARVVALLARLGEPLLRDELERWVDSSEVKSCAEEFTNLCSAVIVPLLVEERVAALIAVGEKLSGDPFFTHDIELLATVGHQAEVALKRAQLYEEVTRMEEEKRRSERLAAIGAFVSGIAHEIRNPLVAIKTLAELLPEQYADEEFRDTFAKVTLQEVDRIDTLVHRLRNLSTGATAPLYPMSILVPLEETLSLLAGELTRGKITVVCEPEPLLPPVLGDHDQLKQVFVNLCLNSIEAMAEGGTLTITVRSDGGEKGQPAALMVQITDTGPGIPAEHLSDIFDPFFTLKDQGTGLGLAICRGIMDYHRGSIAVANQANGPGAIFTLKLPIVQGEVAYEVAAAGG